MIISGINGFVGHHLARELASSNISVIGIGRDADLAPDLKGIVEEYYSADLAVSWPEVTNVDAIIHLAGLAAVGPSFDNPQKYINLNSAMVTNMCEYYLKQDKKPRILVVGSGAVYSADQPMPIDENATLGFSSPYAVSKVVTEHQCAYYNKRGLDCIVARPFNHIGPGQTSGFLLPDLTSGLIEAHKNNTPLLMGDLSTKRDYTDVRDVARAYQLLATTPELHHKIYNVCSGKSIAGNDILNTVKDLLKFDDVTVEVDQTRIRPNDPKDIFGNSQALQSDTGWSPSTPISQTIADYVTSLTSN